MYVCIYIYANTQRIRITTSTAMTNTITTNNNYSSRRPPHDTLKAWGILSSWTSVQAAAGVSSLTSSSHGEQQ